MVQFLCYMLSHSVRECALLSYVLLATLPPIRSPTTNKMLPLVGRETLAGAHQYDTSPQLQRPRRLPLPTCANLLCPSVCRAVRHMAELTKAARGSEPILSVSPHVVPLHARQGAALRGVRDLDDGALQMHQLQGDHPVLGGRVFAQSSDDNLPQPGCPGSGAKHRSYKSYCQGRCPSAATLSAPRALGHGCSNLEACIPKPSFPCIKQSLLCLQGTFVKTRPHPTSLAAISAALPTSMCQ